ncbi:MAG: glycerophosphodiester phosphodiesterase [Solirubrobacterales bacterium]
MRRVGHKGADLIEPGNTLASFDAALAHGVDMIELDVLPERDPGQARNGRLILAHDYEDAAERPTLTLEEGLDHLASPAYAALEFIFDLKLPGYEVRVVEGLERSGLADRAIVSSTYRESLVALKPHHESVRVGWSVPKARRDYTKSPIMAVPALAVLRVMRRRLPRQAAAALSTGLCHAVMAHWRLVTPGLVEAVKAAGGDLYVWTVDHAPRIRELHSLGVTGVITNDPRLFAALP